MIARPIFEEEFRALRSHIHILSRERTKYISPGRVRDGHAIGSSCSSTAATTTTAAIESYLSVYSSGLEANAAQYILN